MRSSGIFLNVAPLQSRPLFPELCPITMEGVGHYENNGRSALRAAFRANSKVGTACLRIFSAILAQSPTHTRTVMRRVGLNSTTVLWAMAAKHGRLRQPPLPLFIFTGVLGCHSMVCPAPTCSFFVAMLGGGGARICYTGVPRPTWCIGISYARPTTFIPPDNRPYFFDRP